MGTCPFPCRVPGIHGGIVERKGLPRRRTLYSCLWLWIWSALNHLDLIVRERNQCKVRLAGCSLPFHEEAGIWLPLIASFICFLVFFDLSGLRVTPGSTSEGYSQLCSRNHAVLGLVSKMSTQPSGISPALGAGYLLRMRPPTSTFNPQNLIWSQNPARSEL